MAETSELFRMLSVEDKLDGNNYPMWAYMMRHVLVAKGFWNIVQGFDVRPGSEMDSGTVEQGAGSSTFAATMGATGSNCLQQQYYPQLNSFVGMVEMRRHMP